MRFDVGVRAGSCFCVGIGFAIVAIVDAGARDTAGASVRCGIAAVWVLSLRLVSVLGLGVVGAAAIIVALVFTLMEEPCWPLRFTERLSECGVAL